MKFEEGHAALNSNSCINLFEIRERENKKLLLQDKALVFIITKKELTSNCCTNQKQNK
jgi:hypothetical protein